MFLFDDRNLPEDRMQSGFFNALDCPPGIFPVFRAVPAIESPFITPGFQDHYVRRIIIFFQCGQLCVYFRVAVPSVRADPHTEGPVRRQRRSPCVPDKLIQDLCGGTKEPQITGQFCPGSLLVCRKPIRKVHLHRDAGIFEASGSLFRTEKRNRKIGVLSLPGKLFRYGT